jgi:hypothetical protein
MSALQSGRALSRTGAAQGKRWQRPLAGGQLAKDSRLSVVSCPSHVLYQPAAFD